MPKQEAIIALGANLGDAAASLLEAIRRLGKHPEIRVLAISKLHRTPPVDCPEGSPDFHNGCAKVETTLDAEALLSVMLETEAEMGRERSGVRNEAREIDLDLIFYGQEVIDQSGLHIPHPRMHERSFVLAPLAEIAPDWVHPTLNKTVSEVLASLPVIAAS